jgi:exopolysaccharide biosynthesis predicted pyruvyltransferase EpsI
MSTESPTSKVATDVLESLRSHAGARAFFKPLPGNHGDRLILLGARHWLAPLGFQWVEDPAKADVIVINGGGGMFVQPWCDDLRAFRRYAQGYPGTPLVVLPSSFYWGESDLIGCFAGRTAGLVLFARELLSLSRLERAGLPDGVSVGLDCDMAFRLAGTPLVEDARRVPSRGYVLLVERFDAEQATGWSFRSGPLRKKLGRRLPAPVRNFLKQVLDRVRYLTSDFRRSALDEALRLRPDLAGKPVVYNDVSDVMQNSFDEFVRIIAAADAVVTTRMHAGILAAMLGKPTFLKGKAGDYRKLQSVYERWLAAMPHVHLLES